MNSDPRGPAAAPLAAPSPPDRGTTVERATMRQRVERLSFVVLAIAALLLQILAADLKGVWGDEVFRLRLINGVGFSIPPQELAIGDLGDVLPQVRDTNYQPLYYLLANLVSRLAESRSPVLFRVLNALFVTLLLWLLARQFGAFRSPPARFVALALVALNGNLLLHVNQVREYPLALLAIAAATSCFFWLHDTFDPGRRGRVAAQVLAYGALLSFAWHVQVLAAFLCASHLPVALLRRRPRTQWLAAVAAAWALAALSAVPWLLYKTGTFGPPLYDPSGRTLANLWQSLTAGALALIAGGSHSPVAHIYLLGILALLAFAAAALWQERQRLDVRAASALVAVLAYLALQIGYFFLVQPFGMLSRYFIFYLLPAAYLAGFAVDRLATRAAAHRLRGRALALLLPLVVVAAGAAQVAGYYRAPYDDTIEDFRKVAAQIRAQVDNDEVLVSFHPWSMNGIRFYWVGPNRFVDVYPHHEFRDFHSRRFGSRLARVVMHGSVSREWIEERIDPALAAAGFREISRAEIKPNFELVHYERDPLPKRPKPPRRPRRARP